VAAAAAVVTVVVRAWIQQPVMALVLASYHCCMARLSCMLVVRDTGCQLSSYGGEVVDNRDAVVAVVGSYSRVDS